MNSGSNPTPHLGPVLLTLGFCLASLPGCNDDIVIESPSGRKLTSGEYQISGTKGDREISVAEGSPARLDPGEVITVLVDGTLKSYRATRAGAIVKISDGDLVLEGVEED